VLSIAGHVEVDPAHRDQVFATPQDVVRRARLAPGCLDAAITADPIDPTRVNILERWESAEHLDQWRAVAHAPHIGVAIRSDHTRRYDVTGERAPFN
jgi:quinol monooxygenase YgiN